jgi:hypothetical protein
VSASTAEKALAVIAFILVGIPTGLCSILSTPFLFGVLGGAVRDREAVMPFLLLYAVPWLVGFAIAYALMRWLRWAFRRDGADNGSRRTST